VSKEKKAKITIISTVIFLIFTFLANVEANDDISMEYLVAEYVVAYYDVKYSPRYLPIDLFTDDLENAQGHIESGGNPNAVSEKGAVGFMQHIEKSIKDICGYRLSQSDIDALTPEKRRYHIKEKGKGRPGYDRIGYIYKLAKKGVLRFHGPDRIDEKQLAYIMEQLKDKYTSLSFRGLYLMQLFDSWDGYGIGREAYEKGDIAEAQFLLMAVYNGGKRRIVGKPTYKWPRESLSYTRKVMNHMQFLLVANP
jgi:hypothetical protein